MNKSVLWGLSFAVYVVAVLAAVWSVYCLAFARGVRSGADATLRELRADLDETIVKWNELGEAGDTARLLELPGIHAVRRMLGNG